MKDLIIGSSFLPLLIVPYGIETFDLYIFKSIFCLLIVPYGIETLPYCVLLLMLFSFNRTLWN